VSADDLYAFHCRDIALLPDAGRSVEIGVLRSAAAHNIRTILSGWGGDEAITFNGRGYLLWLFMTGRWWRFINLLRLWSEWHPKRCLTILFWHALIPLMPLKLYWQFTPISPLNLPPSFVSPDFAA